MPDNKGIIMATRQEQVDQAAYEYMRVNYPYEYALLKREYRENVKTRPEESYPEPGMPAYKVSEEAREAVQFEDLVFPGGSWYSPGSDINWYEIWINNRSHKTASYTRTNTSGTYFSRRNF